MATEDIRVRAIIEAVDRATPTVERTLQTLSRGMRTVGMQMTIVGGVVTGLGALSVKSALSMRSSWALIAAELSNVGDSIDAHKGEIDSVVTAWANLTGTPVAGMLAALGRMQTAIGGPNGLDAALRALPAAALAAKAMNIPINEAADLIVAAFMGDKGAIQKLKNFGVVLKDEGNSWTAIITAVREKFVPQVSAMVTPFDSIAAAAENLKARIGELISTSLFEPMAQSLIAIIDNMNTWIDTNPKLASSVATAFFGAGGIILALGTALYIAGQLAAAIVAISRALPVLAAASAALGAPIGLVVAAIAVFIAGLILLIVYWNQIRDAFNAFADTTIGKVILAFTALTSPIGLLVVTLALLAFNWDTVWTAIVNTIAWARDAIIDAVNFIVGGLNILIDSLNVVLGALNSVGASVGRVPSIGLIQKAGTTPTLAPGPSFARAGAIAASGGVTINFNGPTYGLEDLDTRIKQAVQRAASGGGFDATFASQ